MAILAFDANQHEPSKPMGPVPEGAYLVAIRESEVKPTKAGNGEYLALTFVILEGEHKGRKVYDNLNINNPNPQATQIAQENLSAICHAVNVLKLQDSIQLHDLPLMVDVKCESYNKPNGDRAIKNTIYGYKSKLHTEPVVDGHQGEVGGVPPQQPAYAQPAPAGAPIASPANAPAYGQPAVAPGPAPWAGQA